jgi:bis(5'-nucleosyl)-tetraphosphatase (symmetrical)
MRTIFVGDLHGCAAEFAEILEQVNFAKGRDRLLLTGDAFSRGPDPLEVWQLIRETSAAMVLGNHDARLLRQLADLAGGGRPAVEKPDQRFTLEKLCPVAGKLLAWLEQVPLFIQEKRFLLVHAGIHPEKGLAGTSRDQFLSIRTWPPREGTQGPRWHEYYEPVHELLVFGHDAPGGLVIKKRARGRPYLLGLDTGCVYGNLLSAYVLEEDRLVQAPSRQPPGAWKKSDE